MQHVYRVACWRVRHDGDYQPENTVEALGASFARLYENEVLAAAECMALQREAREDGVTNLVYVVELFDEKEEARLVSELGRRLRHAADDCRLYAVALRERARDEQNPELDLSRRQLAEELLSVSECVAELGWELEDAAREGAA